jgi:peroxiredoxin
MGMLLPSALALVLAAAPTVGAIAPDFTAKDSEGQALTLSELVKSGPVVLAFFPKAFTPGCTKQLTAFREKSGQLSERAATVLAISTDDAKTLERFKAELKAPYRFVPDPEAKLVALFDMKMPLVSYAKRANVVVGEGRKILEVQLGSDAIDPAASVAACPLKRPQEATEAPAKAPAKP